MQDRTPDGPVRELLAAVLDALDIPSPATVGDSETHDRILNDRVMHAKIALRSALEEHPLGTEWTTSYLREQLLKHPADGYQHWNTDRTKAGR